MNSRNSVLWIVLGFGFLGVAFIYSATRSAEVMGEFLTTDVWQDSSDELDDADVALLSLKGVILDSEAWLKKLKKAEKSEAPAVVIRIDSPGGAVAPSQEMYQAVLKLRAKKKVYCSFGDLAASGGYYIGSACEKIVSNSGTITGSIGVIMSFVNLKDLYEWAKISPVTIKAGKFKDVGNQARSMRPDEKALLQDLIDEVHTQFKDDVMAARPKLTKELIQNYADGRIFTGTKAVALGFADQVGTLADTMDLVKKELKIDRELVIVNLDKKANKLERFLEERFTGDRSTSISNVADEILSKLGRIAPPLRSEIEAGKPYLLPYFWFQNAGQNGNMGLSR